MSEKNLNVLMLSFDGALINGAEGETLIRLVGYSSLISQLTVLVPNTRRDSYREINPKLKIIGIGGLTVFKLIKLIFEAIRLGSNTRIDLIVTSDPVLGFLGWIIKLIFPKSKLNINVFALEITEPEWLRTASLKDRLLRTLSIIALKKADSIRSDSTRAVVGLRSLGITGKVIVIPILPSPKTINRLTEINLQQEDAPLVPGIADDDDVVLSVGHLINQKDHITLISSAKDVVTRFPRTKFLIIGSGPLKNKLASLIKKLSLEKNVILLEAKSLKELALYYKRCTVFVMSSLYEGGPRVVVEAALVGKPIITTDVGSVRDLIINNFSGTIIPIKDQELLARAIISLLQDKKKRALFAKRIKERAKKYCQKNGNYKILVDFWLDTIKP